MRNQGIRSLGDDIGKLTALRKLNLAANLLQTIPEGLGKLTNLTDLNLESNPLRTLPEGLWKLTNLRKLDLKFDRFQTLPEGLWKLTNLTDLDLGWNRLSSLPEALGELTNLTYLNLAGNSLVSLPEGLWELTKLTHLNVGANLLASLPEGLGKLVNLTYLNLGNNRLTNLPESLGNLTALTELDLSNNWLTALPESIGKLTNLRSLNLTSNNLARLPRSIGRLNLRAFHIRDNPVSIGSPDTGVEFLRATKKARYRALERWRRAAQKAAPSKKEKGPQFVWQKMCFDFRYSVKDLLFYLVEEAALVLKTVCETEVSKELLTNLFRERYHDLLKGGKKGNLRLRVKRYICLDLFTMYETYLGYVGSEEFKEKCKDESPLTGGEYFEVPFGQLVVFKQGGQTYCFTTEEISKFPKGQNPWTRQPLPEGVFETARLRGEIFGGWYERAEAPEEEDEKMEKRALYSLLWYKLGEVSTQPIAQDVFDAASPAQVRDMFGMIQISPNRGALSAGLESFDTHLSFVRQSLRLLGDRSMVDSKGDRLLIDQAMKQATGRAEI